MRRSTLTCTLLLLAACSADGRPGADDGLNTSLTTLTTNDSTGSGDGDGDDAPGDGDGDPTGDGDATGDGDDDPIKFDMGPIPDGGDDTGEEGPIIPETCEQASSGNTTVGCLFYAVDLDQNGGLEHDQYAIAVSNVQLAKTATVTVERKVGGAWQVVAGPTMVAPLGLATFPLPNNNQQGSGIKSDGSWRVSSDVPIIASTKVRSSSSSPAAHRRTLVIC